MISLTDFPLLLYLLNHALSLFTGPRPSLKVELVENSSYLVTVIVDILTEIKSLETDVQPRQEIKPEG